MSDRFEISERMLEKMRRWSEDQDAIEAQEAKKKPKPERDTAFLMHEEDEHPIDPRDVRY